MELLVIVAGGIDIGVVGMVWGEGFEVGGGIWFTAIVVVIIIARVVMWAHGDKWFE